MNFLTSSQSFLKYNFLALNDSYSFFIKSSRRLVSSFFVIIFKFAKQISRFFSIKSFNVSLFSLNNAFILYFFFVSFYFSSYFPYLASSSRTNLGLKCLICWEIISTSYGLFGSLILAYVAKNSSRSWASLLAILTNKHNFNLPIFIIDRNDST